MNGLSLLALVVCVVAVAIAYRLGRIHARGDRPAARLHAGPRGDPAERALDPVPSDASAPRPLAGASAEAPRAEAPSADPSAADAPPAYASHAEQSGAGGDPPNIAAEKARLIRAYESESTALRRRLLACDARAQHLEALAEDRRALFRELALARAEAARYRQVVVDLENDAPPPILGERGAPDDLKLIVGIGPVLERMLQQLGVATYRQIARWTEHDIDAMDARLPEFPGRIRRDAWVTQARELHQSKYGERP